MPHNIVNNVQQDSEPVRRIVVSNLFGDINRGGAAITAETIEVAQATGARVAGISIQRVDPETSHPHTRARFPEVPIYVAPLTARPGPLRGLRQTLRSLGYLARPYAEGLPEGLDAVRKSDLVISKGGYVFVDRSSLKNLMAMWSTVFPLVYAIRIGVPVVAFPTSVSPQRHWGSKTLSRWLLPRISTLFARDPLSARAARNLGVADDVIVEVPDIVLGMDPPDEADIERQCSSVGVEPGRFATFTVQLRDRAANRPREFAALAQVAAAVLAHPKIEVVLVVDQAGDSRDSAELVHLIGDRARLVDDNLSPADLVALYGGSALTVACRLHSAIFSLVAGTPAVAVSVTPLKAEGVYASLDLPSHWVVPIDDVDHLGAVVAEVLNQPWSSTEIREHVATAAAELGILRARLERLLLGG